MNMLSNMSQLYGMFKQFDRDGDGSVTENDFILILRSIGLGSIGDTAGRAAFRQMDKNRNGKIDINEAIGIVSMLTGGGHAAGQGGQAAMGGQGGMGGLMGGLTNALGGGMGGNQAGGFGQIMGGLSNAFGGMGGGQGGFPGMGGQGGFPGMGGQGGGFF